MKRLASIALTALTLNTAFAEAPAVEATCRACHGVNGAAPIMGAYPKLNGQNKEYLVSALKAYKTGQRTGGFAAVMNAQSANLSEADIEALAEFYSSK